MQTHTDPIELTPKFFSDQKSVTSHGDNQSDASYLPCEILQQILSRLPFKSVLRFQIVSKSWNALISEPGFSRVQSANNSDDSHSLFLWQSYVSGLRRQLHVDYSDLTIDHSDWKALLPPDKHEVVWKSAYMGFSIGMSSGEEFVRKWKMTESSSQRNVPFFYKKNPSLCHALVMQTLRDPIEVTQKFSDQKLVSSHGDASYLPREIIQEILSRLPFKSVHRFRIVSKSWNALISKPRFSRVHLNQSKKKSVDSPSRLLLWQSYVSAHRRQLPMDYSDLTIDHSDWKALLPPDKQEVVWKSASMWFSIEQRTGKNCFMVGPGSLGMTLGEEFDCKWEIKSHPESRFSKVAKLVNKSREIFIRGVLKLSMLSPKTFYAAYLVFRFTENIESANSFIKHFCGQPHYDLSSEQAPIVQFRPGKGRKGQIAVSRGDGWMEVEIGEFLVTKGDNRDIEAVLLMQTKGYSMRCLIIEGIEFRPSET